jgi:large subunit ribosomal protein L7/L12
VNAGPQKIQVIKAVRLLTNLGLKEAKDIVDCAPSCMKAAVQPDEIGRFLEVIQAAGGRAEARPQV